MYNLNMVEFISQILPIIQIVIAVILVTMILLQQIGGGLGAAFGGGISSYHTKRGFEKMLFTGTIIFAILFAITSILALII